MDDDPSTPSSTALAQSFQREAAILMCLRHPNVVMFMGGVPPCLSPPGVVGLDVLQRLHEAAKLEVLEVDPGEDLAEGRRQSIVFTHVAMRAPFSVGRAAVDTRNSASRAGGVKGIFMAAPKIGLSRARPSQIVRGDCPGVAQSVGP
eukprot:CAMPEP_0198228576 /NCGR_PEP_ID=MMETSP1445-20131203/113663_1 /TAXON_ID=36898 /ORGANISM="Pyramimonas sp., Strain CCMP2087" /LENGTH=146 /DNA_ID=CAMNT_0043908977 /DNA_START=509 /DNA_END=948 /DNA_ORIENTATION=+